MGGMFWRSVFAGRGQRRKQSTSREDDWVRVPAQGGGFDSAIESVGGFEAWLRRRRGESRQICEQALSALSSVKDGTPQTCTEALTAAEAIMCHRFDLLGSGTFIPIDPSRSERNGYTPIDWFLDPVRDLRFPPNIPHKDWDLYAMRPKNADIKYPWELARCQHFLPLAQAFLVSGEERFASEMLDQCDDFIEANPIGIGVNWTCTMDVAIRAANWCLALCLIKEAAHANASRLHPIYEHLYTTGMFISANLEDKYEVTSNHFLSDVVGLHVLAAEFADLDAGREWDAFARNCLEREIFVQTLEDGADFESSVPYHRLVTELFLGSYRLSQVQGAPLSGGYRDRLSRMVEFLVAILRPDGLMPVVGDNDDGRLMIATGYGSCDRLDPRPLLAPAGLTLDRADWLALAGDRGLWEAFWWGFAADNARAEAQDLADDCRLFPEAGIFVSRSAENGSYLIVTNGIVGTEGFGNHKHNDLLGFEYHDLGQALIVDPGSYVYTSDFEARNLFRSTGYHNTVVIDGVEQNEFNPEWLFRMFAKATPEHRYFQCREGSAVYEGAHDGYVTQLSPGVRHIRRFEHDRRSGELKVTDRFDGAGVHRFEWNFHFDPGVVLELETNRNQARLGVGDRAWEFGWQDSSFQAQTLKGWISPSYGVKIATSVLRLASTAEVRPDVGHKFTCRRVEVTRDLAE